MASKKIAKFGKTLRLERVRRGVSMRRLAAAVGLSPTYLSQIELGRLPAPAWETMMHIATVLDSRKLLITSRETLRSKLAETFERAVDSIQAAIDIGAIRGEKGWKRKMRDAFSTVGVATEIETEALFRSQIGKKRLGLSNQQSGKK